MKFIGQLRRSQQLRSLEPGYQILRITCFLCSDTISPAADTMSVLVLVNEMSQPTPTTIMKSSVILQLSKTSSSNGAELCILVFATILLPTSAAPLSGIKTCSSSLPFSTCRGNGEILDFAVLARSTFINTMDLHAVPQLCEA